MSTNLTESAPASAPDSTAPTTQDGSTATPNAPSEAAGGDVGSTRANAASGVDATIANLDRQYREARTLLTRDDEDSEPEQPESQPEKQPEVKEPEQPETAVEEPETEEVDPLAEQTGPRTQADFDKLFAPSQKAARQELARIEGELWETKATVEAIGGKEGVEIAKPIMAAILAADPTAPILGEDGKPVFEDDGSPRTYGDEALDAILSANPAAGVEMSRRLLSHAFNETSIDPATGLTIAEATANAMIKQYLNPDADLAGIKELMEFEEKGLIDRDTLREEAKLYSGKSARELELENRLKAVEDRDKAEQAAKEMKAEQEKNERYEKHTGQVQKRIMDTIIPIAQHFGWTATQEELNSTDPAIKQLAEAKIAMGEMLSDHMEAARTRLPEWAAVEHLIKENRAFNADGNPTVVFTKNSDALVNKLVASFKAKVRVLNPTFAKSFGASRSVQLKEKTTRNGQVLNREIPPVKKAEERPKGNGVQDTVAKLDDDYRRALREARA